MTLTTFIYALCEPETGEIRYIGKSNDPNARLSGHIRDEEINRRTNWIKHLRARGKAPELSVLLEIPLPEWGTWERAFIKFFRGAGCDLVNATDGGDSGPTLSGRAHPQFGIPKTDAHKQRVREAMLGKPKTEAQRDKERRLLRPNNTSGVPGVDRDRGRWKARVTVAGNRVHLGCFATVEEAAAARAVFLEKTTI